MGVEKLEESHRKQELKEWITDDLSLRFKDRVLPVDLAVSKTWGKLQAKAETAGTPMPAIDGLIATIGVYHHLTIVTRNTEHMQASGADLFNPWDE